MALPLKWWGYRHNNGTIHVRRFLAEGYGISDMKDAQHSPFIRDVFGPFNAQNQHAAKVYLEKITDGNEEVP